MRPSISWAISDRNLGPSNYQNKSINIDFDTYKICLTLCTVDKSQKSLFRIENGSKLLSIRFFDIASFRTPIIERRISSRRSLNGFFPTFSF